MNMSKVYKVLLTGGASLLAVLLTLLTRSVGRGQCPECGYRDELHQCKHCSWAACLECWQRLSKYNTCPKCGRANP